MKIDMFAVAAGIGLAIAATTTAAVATPNPKVAICHATASDTHPYTANTVDESSIDRSPRERRQAKALDPISGVEVERLLAGPAEPQSAQRRVDTLQVPFDHLAALRTREVGSCAERRREPGGDQARGGSGSERCESIPAGEGRIGETWHQGRRRGTLVRRRSVRATRRLARRDRRISMRSWVTGATSA